MNWILTCLLLAAFAVASAAEGGAVKTLNLEECIRIALEHNFDVKIERRNLTIGREKLSLALGSYDPVLTLESGRSDNLSPGGIDDKNRAFAGTTTARDGFSAGLGGILPTGTKYQFSGDLGDAHGSSPAGPFENTSGGALIRLSQPLLKNMWIDEPRMLVGVARRQLKASEARWKGQLMEVVTAVEVAYYGLLLARENQVVQEQALQLAQTLLNENRERIKQGVMAALDEKQAEAQVSAQRALLLSSKRLVSVEENVLKRLLSDSFAEWKDISIQLEGDLAVVEQPVNREESWKRGLAMRTDLIKARDDFDRLGYIERYTRNQTLPQLDLVGSYGHSASEAEFSGALGQLRSGSSPFHSFGLQLSIPIGGRSARSAHRASREERDQSELVLKQLEQDVLIQIDDAVKVAETSFQRVGATRDARDFAQKALQAEQTKMENGKSTSFFVLQLQRDLTAARSEEVKALAEYNRALSLLALREGSVLERRRLDVRIQ